MCVREPMRVSRMHLGYNVIFEEFHQREAVLETVSFADAHDIIGHHHASYLLVHPIRIEAACTLDRSISVDLQPGQLWFACITSLKP
jgi:hypothetical protein